MSEPTTTEQVRNSVKEAMEKGLDPRLIIKGLAETVIALDGDLATSQSRVTELEEALKVIAATGGPAAFDSARRALSGEKPGATS